MLYREPKLLKVERPDGTLVLLDTVSVLYREPKLLKGYVTSCTPFCITVSVLYREPKLLKATSAVASLADQIMFQCSTVSRNC